ncbi:MAG: Uma2 family endonuclease [Isosphaeraceae bacterium]
MSLTLDQGKVRKVEYPDSDGQPMAENTLQFDWIVTIKENLADIFRGDPNVFVAGDLLWYPIEGDNKTRAAPDAMVALGRPSGYRGSYKQWEEGGIAPQVVFEVLSSGNRIGEMTRKFQFYSDFGVEEYYVLDPYDPMLDGWERRDGKLREIEAMDGWTSPRLGIRFAREAGEWKFFRPDGRPFFTFQELRSQLDAEAEKARAEAQRADEATRRVEALKAQLRALGIEPEA